MSQPFGCAMPNLCTIGTQADRPKAAGSAQWVSYGGLEP